MENEISSLNKEKKLLKKQIEMQKGLYDEKIQLLEEKNKKYKIRLTEQSEKYKQRNQSIAEMKQ